ncbi:MAG: type II toxin-antitoxin system VapC family toxin [Candidatus Korarchaeota archaeon]|nr:type II toxin-antitoxin system VapC family toxin [Candidatus Korarchaeota archaeon]
MLVIDSSIFASVIVKDEFYEKCKEYLSVDRATVDIAFAEAGNVLWKHVRMGRIEKEEVERRTELLRALIRASRVYGSDELLPPSMKLAVNHGITIYDALFLSLALQLDTNLVTTDRKLYERLSPDLRRRVILLK